MSSTKTLNTSQENKPPRILMFALAAIPLASVLAVSLLVMLAGQYPDTDISTGEQPLSKTSWRQASTRDTRE